MIVYLFFIPMLFAQIEKFVGYPFLVEDLQQEKADRFIDVFSEWGSGNEADSLAPSPQNFGWLGACVRKDQEPCVRNINGRELIMSAFYRSLGTFDMVGRIDLSGVPEGEMQVQSSWSEKGDQLQLEVIKKIGDNRYLGKYKLHRIGRLSDRQVRLKFLRTARSNREPFSQQTLDRKELSSAVVQIASGPIDLKNLLGRIVKSGTGFFISESGLFLTNNHVIASYPDCLKYLQCQLTIRKVFDEKKSKEFQVAAKIYAHSESYDFALLRLDPPFSVTPIDLEDEQIGPDVMTLGFSGDRISKSGNIALTYSFGNLAGFKSKSFSTTVYVYPGASGSPLLNMSNNKLVGIVSDVQGDLQKGPGNPAIARPIDIIDDDFGIREYLSGEKQSRIDQLLDEIQATDIDSTARRLLKQYVKENSLYRIGSLHQIAIEHRSPSIRKMTYQSLQDLNLIRGPL